MVKKKGKNNTQNTQPCVFCVIQLCIEASKALLEKHFLTHKIISESEFYINLRPRSDKFLLQIGAMSAFLSAFGASLTTLKLIN